MGEKQRNHLTRTRKNTNRTSILLNVETVRCFVVVVVVLVLLTQLSSINKHALELNEEEAHRPIKN